MKTLMTMRPGGAVTAEAALALYDVAVTSGAASAYEAAAHALAKALQRQKALSLALGRPAPATPLGAPCEPAPAAPRRKVSAKAAKVADDDLTALFTAPRNKAVTGSFWVVWDDGSATHVSGVVYNGAKAQTRWAAALRAADQLRRLRARHAYALELEAMAAGAVPGLKVRTSADVMVDSPDWQRLTAVRPMAALAAIYDETSGEMFTPPGGRDYAAGDLVEARALEGRLVPPRLFWRQTEIKRQGGFIYDRKGDGAAIVYELPHRRNLLMADMSPHALRSMRASALEAFSDGQETPPVVTADPGEPVPQSFFDLDGRAVVIDPEAADTKAHSYWVANWATDSAGKLIRWTFKRLPGGREFRLTRSDGRCVNVDGSKAKLLRLAA